jgi:hypothetical protein
MTSDGSCFKTSMRLPSHFDSKLEPSVRGSCSRGHGFAGLVFTDRPALCAARDVTTGPVKSGKINRMKLALLFVDH